METVPVKISAKSMRLEFNGCETDFIKNVCHGRCCWVVNDPAGTTVHVEQDQVAGLKKLGVKINADNILETVNKRCFFQDESGFCKAHKTDSKPRSCIQSPFMLNKHDTLLIRNRYKLLPCFKAEPRLPVYKAFATGFRLLFGKDEAARLTKHLDSGGGDIIGYMIKVRYMFLKRVTTVWQKTKSVQRPQGGFFI